MSDDKKSRILAAARSVFLSYGYKRVNMNDIAEAAGVSRPALYVLFKNKEEIFIEAYLRWVDETIAQVEAAMAQTALPKDKMARAFEIWAVGPFEMTMASLAAEELVDCNFAFAQACPRAGLCDLRGDDRAGRGEAERNPSGGIAHRSRPNRACPGERRARLQAVGGHAGRHAAAH